MTLYPLGLCWFVRYFHMYTDCGVHKLEPKELADEPATLAGIATE